MIHPTFKRITHIKHTPNSDIVFQALQVTLTCSHGWEIALEHPLFDTMAQRREKGLKELQWVSGCPEREASGSWVSPVPIQHITLPLRGVPALQSCIHFASLFCKIETQKELQLIPEQHGFGLRRSDYLLIFFSPINIFLDFSSIPWFNQQYFQSVFENPHTWRAECMHYSYHFIQGTWASLNFGIHWGPGINPLWIPNFGGVKS